MGWSSRMGWRMGWTSRLGRWMGGLSSRLGVSPVGLGVACGCGHRLRRGNSVWFMLAMERLGVGGRLLSALRLRLRALPILVTISERCLAREPTNARPRGSRRFAAAAALHRIKRRYSASGPPWRMLTQTWSRPALLT